MRILYNLTGRREESRPVRFLSQKYKHNNEKKQNNNNTIVMWHICND